MTTVLLLASCASGNQLKADVQTEPGRQIVVKGTVNLPDRAQLLVAMRSPGQAMPIVQGLPLVQNGAFEQKLQVASQVAPGAYEIRVLFSPQSFDWSGGKVAAAVGAKGEKLTGSQVKQDGEYKILETVIPFSYDGK